MMSIETRTQICEALKDWLKKTLDDAKKLRAASKKIIKELDARTSPVNDINEEKGEQIFSEKFRNATHELAEGNAAPLLELYAEAVRITGMLDASREAELTPEEVFSFTFLSRKHLDEWKSLLPISPVSA